TLFHNFRYYLFEAVFVFGQTSPHQKIQQDFDKGHFTQVMEKAPAEIARTRIAGDFDAAARVGVLGSRSLMHLERYDTLPKLLDEALSDALKPKSAAKTVASVYFCRAALMRTRRDFREAVEFARKGLAAAPDDTQVELEYYLNIGRILYSAEYDISAIVWLEKAERLSHAFPRSALQIEVLRSLSLAWSSKFDYAKALAYAKKVTEISESTEFRYRHRLGLYDLSTLLDAAGQKTKARTTLEKALGLALAAKDDYLSCLSFSTLLLSSLYEGDVASAESHLGRLDKLDQQKRFAFEVLLGRAVIAAFKGQDAVAGEYFSRLDSTKNYSDHIVPYWKATIAERRKDWEGLLKQNSVLKDLSEKGNFRDDLPGIYLAFAKAYWGLGKREQAFGNARRAVSMIDEIRPANNTPLSLGMLEVYNSAYRLLAEISYSDDDSGSKRESFELSDYLKARVLKDRIENSVVMRRSDFSPETRKRIDELSSKFVEGTDTVVDLEKIEREKSIAVPDVEMAVPDLGQLENLKDLNKTAIVSYLFTTSGELWVYVWEKDKSVRVIRLSVSDREAEAMAISTNRKIRNLIFFKKDGKEIYDRLLAPLSLTAEHFVIIHDKSLWKIPFHALSPDGTSYLIEKRLISYTPSAALLLRTLKEKVPERKTIQAFANDSYQKRFLPYVNKEAAKVAAIYGSKPLLGASRNEFLKRSTGSDILHFSMHAQVDDEDPLASFLGFRESSTTDGRVSVSDLLKVSLKHQSLAFLAACDTSNVMNGEGLVSIAWAMLGSGSTAVISAQWEANDKSTEMFAEQFYSEYKKGVSIFRAMQLASIAMIKNKSSETHEPYYWVAFTLLGDFR
ncbi:MAG: CHAT domain-containing protein, partial [Pyrinomonadaceae bacterium]